MISEIAEPPHCESDPAEGPLPFGERNRLLKLGIQERDETTVCNVSLIQFAMQRLCWPCRGHSSAAFSFDIDVESGQIDSVTSPKTSILGKCKTASPDARWEGPPSTEQT